MKKNLLIFIFIICCTLLFAKKGLGFVPPPYSYRVFCSIITLGPIAILLFVLSYLYIKIADRNVTNQNLYKLIIFIVCNLLLCCFIAALDGLNDECWNPAATAVLLPLFILFVIPILSKKWKITIRIVVGIILFVFSSVIIRYVAIFWQNYAECIGLPSTW